MSKARSFEVRFVGWLDECLAAGIPKAVRAFTFCVSEGELCSCLELNGTSEFSEHGREWTWSEIWQAPAGRLVIPNGGFGDSADVHWWTIERLVSEYCRTGVLRQRLTTREAVALETLEGGFQLVHRRFAHRVRAVG